MQPFNTAVMYAEHFGNIGYLCAGLYLLTRKSSFLNSALGLPCTVPVNCSFVPQTPPWQAQASELSVVILKNPSPPGKVVMSH